MSIYGILRRLLSRHVLFHLLIPLIVGLMVEVFIDYRAGIFHGWQDYLFFIKEHSGLVAAVFVTYLIIGGYFLYKETKIQTEKSHLADLKNTLKSAESYFATSTIKMRDWFEPYVQAYLSYIVNRQLQYAKFRHDRVLLFFREKEIKDLKSEYLDENYAKALLTVHNHYNIRLAYLKRDDILQVLRNLTFKDKKTLRCFPRWIRLFRRQSIMEWLLEKRPRIPELDFAFVTHSGKNPTVFPFSIDADHVRIKKEENQECVDAYKNLVTEIEKVIYEDSDKQDSDTRTLKPTHDFNDLF